jgi:hypothetical protein
VTTTGSEHFTAQATGRTTRSGAPGTIRKLLALLPRPAGSDDAALIDTSAAEANDEVRWRI